MEGGVEEGRVFGLGQEFFASFDGCDVRRVVQGGEFGELLYFSDRAWSEFGGFFKRFTAVHHAVSNLGDFFKVLDGSIELQALEAIVQRFQVVFGFYRVLFFGSVVQISPKVAMFLANRVDVTFVELLQFPVKERKAEGRGAGVEDEDGHKI